MPSNSPPNGTFKMTIRLTPNAFGIESSRDMLMKLHRDFERLERSTERQDAIDNGLCFAMTAWHLLDWIWAADVKCSSKYLTKLGGQYKQRQDFVDHVLKACPAIRYCQIIATSAKHLYYKTKPQDPNFKTGVERATITWVNNQGQTLAFVNDKNDPIKWTVNAWELYIFEEDTHHQAVKVFAEVLNFWEHFLEKAR